MRRPYEGSFIAWRHFRRRRASAITPATALSLAGAITCTPAIPGDRSKLLDEPDADALPLRRRIGRALEPLHKSIGNDRAVEVLLHPARGFRRAQRGNADEQKKIAQRWMLLEPRRIAPHDLHIHAELGLRELRAGFDFPCELVGVPAGGRVDRHIGGAKKKLCAARNLAPGGQHCLIAQVAGNARERGRINVEHGFRLRLIARFRIIAGEAQNVAHAARRRADELAFKRNAVAVATGELEHRLQALAREQGGCNRRRQMRARARAVGDIDGIGQSAQRQRTLQEVLRAKGCRRRNLRRDDEAARSQPLLEHRNGRSWRSVHGCW